MNQPEGFKLMAYACKNGCHREVIWNSRDGITPFGIMSRDRKCEMNHVDWNRDVCSPQYLPIIGDRVFVDLTMEQALSYRREQVEKAWNSGEYPMKDHDFLGPMGKEGAALHLAEADVESFAPHTPHLIEVDEGVLEFLRGKRATNPPEPVKTGRRFA